MQYLLVTLVSIIRLCSVWAGTQGGSILSCASCLNLDTNVVWSSVDPQVQAVVSRKEDLNTNIRFLVLTIRNYQSIQPSTVNDILQNGNLNNAIEISNNINSSVSQIEAFFDEVPWSCLDSEEAGEGMMRYDTLREASTEILAALVNLVSALRSQEIVNQSIGAKLGDILSPMKGIVGALRAVPVMSVKDRVEFSHLQGYVSIVDSYIDDSDISSPITSSKMSGSKDKRSCGTANPETILGQLSSDSASYRSLADSIIDDIHGTWGNNPSNTIISSGSWNNLFQDTARLKLTTEDYVKNGFNLSYECIDSTQLQNVRENYEGVLADSVRMQTSILQFLNDYTPDGYLCANVTGGLSALASVISELQPLFEDAIAREPDISSHIKAENGIFEQNINATHDILEVTCLNRSVPVVTPCVQLSSTVSAFRSMSGTSLSHESMQLSGITFKQPLEFINSLSRLLVSSVTKASVYGNVSTGKQTKILATGKVKPSLTLGPVKSVSSDTHRILSSRAAASSGSRGINFALSSQKNISTGSVRAASGNVDTFATLKRALRTGIKSKSRSLDHDSTVIAIRGNKSGEYTHRNSATPFSEVFSVSGGTGLYINTDFSTVPDLATRSSNFGFSGSNAEIYNRFTSSDSSVATISDAIAGRSSLASAITSRGTKTRCCTAERPSDSHSIEPTASFNNIDGTVNGKKPSVKVGAETSRNRGFSTTDSALVASTRASSKNKSDNHSPKSKIETGLATDSSSLPISVSSTAVSYNPAAKTPFQNHTNYDRGATSNSLLIARNKPQNANPYSGSKVHQSFATNVNFKSGINEGSRSDYKEIAARTSANAESTISNNSDQSIGAGASSSSVRSNSGSSGGFNPDSEINEIFPASDDRSCRNTYASSNIMTGVNTRGRVGSKTSATFDFSVDVFPSADVGTKSDTMGEILSSAGSGRDNPEKASHSANIAAVNSASNQNVNPVVKIDTTPLAYSDKNSSPSTTPIYSTIRNKNGPVTVATSSYKSSACTPPNRTTTWGSNSRKSRSGSLGTTDTSFNSKFDSNNTHYLGVNIFEVSSTTTIHETVTKTNDQIIAGVNSTGNVEYNSAIPVTLAAQSRDMTSKFTGFISLSIGPQTTSSNSGSILNSAAKQKMPVFMVGLALLV